MLNAMVLNKNTESIELLNRAVIEITTASHRSTRGYTCSCVICDEIAFWMTDCESANPDKEILNALRPSLLTLKGKLIALSSPYARKGVLWEAYRDYFGNDKTNRILVAQAATEKMNPLVDGTLIKQAYEEDSAHASAEYGAQFRVDVESFVSIEVVEACTRTSHVQLPHNAQNNYFAFVDPSGGSADSFSMSIAHKEGELTLIDLVHWRKPPFSPEAVVNEFCSILEAYQIGQVKGDAYAGEWPREQFEKRGILYSRIAEPKSTLYQELLPLLNSERIQIPNLQQLQKELIQLERRTSRSGRDSIDHPPNGHDDIANAVAGVAFICKTPAEIPVFIKRYI